MARKDRRDRKSTSEKVVAESSSKEQKVRKPCLCEAKQHYLINNCLSCGRIVCSGEGSGPCFTCGNLVCTNDEKNEIASGSQAGNALRKKLMGDDFSLKSMGKIFCQEYEASKAISHKNKLLEYDRISKQQTKIIDDQCDYHGIDSNKWLTSDQKQKMLKKQEEILDKKYSNKSNLTFDFAGRKIVEDAPEEEEFDVDALLNEDESIFEHAPVSNTDMISNYRPKYHEPAVYKSVRQLAFDKNSSVRIQNPELQCMSDAGMCLSMHQPYASLLIAGIKLHEGRQWYSPFRGRLWIQAAAYTPKSDEIAQVEAVYRENKGDGIVFPATYPTGCLLGCVEVTDCLSQEEYMERYPGGECGSVFVYICENPMELKIKIPMRGKRRIFKMESVIHKAAKKTLRVIR